MRSLLLFSILIGLTFGCHRRKPPVVPLVALKALQETEAHPERPPQADPLLKALAADVGIYRRLVLLVADEPRVSGAARVAALEQGRGLHHERRALVSSLDAALARLSMFPPTSRDAIVHALIDWMERDRDLLELDRLAFKDPLHVLKKTLAHDIGPEGVVLRQRIDAILGRIERLGAEVEAEYRPFMDLPGPVPLGRRPRWEAYVAELRKRIPTPPAPALPLHEAPAADRELTGAGLPERVLVLSFDDGPHHAYTEPLKALLLKEHIPAVFFQVGRNLGKVDSGGHVVLGPLAFITRDLVQAGFKVGNHSYTHAQLSKEDGAPLDLEIRETDLILCAIPGAHSQLFRFPFGARTALQLDALKPFKLRSVLWNIDSLDWADPIPASVEARVLKSIRQEKRGIVLFHDIHDRALKLLPDLILRLRAEGFIFAGLDEEGNLVVPPSVGKPTGMGNH